MTRAWRERACAAALALACPLLARAYEDRVLEEGPQVVLRSAPELGAASGWSRYWRAEYGLASERGVFDSNAQTLAVYGSIDTPQWGTLALQASTGRSRYGSGLREQVSSWRIDQLALPLAGGWLANHSAGNVAGLQVPMTRGFGRFGLPASQVLGVAGEWTQAAGGHHTLALGQPNLYSAIGTSSWEPSRGRLLFAGSQLPLAGGAGGTLGLQLASARQVSDSPGATPLDSQGIWAGWRWEGRAPWADALEPGGLPPYLRSGGLQVQANVMRSDSRRDGLAPSHGMGSWIDARWQGTLLAQSAGLFWLQPRLRWGSFQTASDTRGGYWRGEAASRQWYLGGSAEWADSVTGATASSAYLSVSTRYRTDLRNTLLASLANRSGFGSGSSGRIGWNHDSAWGQSQWYLDGLRAPHRRALRAGLDHQFTFSSDTVLGTSLAYERGTDFDLPHRALLWGLIGSFRPATGVALDANLRGSSGTEQRVVEGSVGGSWQLTPNWTLLGQLTLTHGQQLQPLAVLSPVTQASELATPTPLSQRRLQLTLRYQESAGRTSAPLGGTRGSAAGAIAGQVFFDENGNGRREASEGGAADVVVRLDGRYSARTDATGHYGFPLVAAGRHVIEVIKDNIPLPWNPVQERRMPIEVQLRGETTFDFPLRKDR